MRLVSTRVLPEPAPATTSSGEPACCTARRCWSLRSVSSSAELARGGLAGVWGGISNRVLIVGTTVPARTDNADAASRAGGQFAIRDVRIRHVRNHDFEFFYGTRTPAPVVA